MVRIDLYESERKNMTIKELQTIIKDIENSPLMTLELEMVDFKLKLSKNKVEYLEKNIENYKEVKHNDMNTNMAISQDVREIKSPLVGTFYLSAVNNGKPYVEVGQKVEKGQVVCIIEAMKIMNEITSPYAGTLKKVTVNNAEAVGFDQLLMVIDNES